jgi:hypothetical protein
MDITDFLLARIAEDEAVARAAADAKPGAHYSDASRVGPAWSADDGMVFGEDDLWEDEGADSLRMAAQAAEHIARHDPDRVLRRCAADRKIIEMSTAWPSYGTRAALIYLAVSFADHPDYRPEWAI